MRRQLVLMTLAVTSIVVIAFVLPLALLVRTIAADRAISQANTDAQYVGQLIAGNRRAAPALVAQVDASSRGRISVYFTDGTVVGDHSRLPDADSLQLARQGRTFRRKWSGGVDVFLPVLGAAGQTAVVRVSVANRELERGVWAAWWSLAALGVVLIGVAVFVADRIARSITTPMKTLTDIARRLADGDLDARSRVQGSPEVVEVSRALDALASRIGDLLRAEREHAADLSHSLRTPLTALRLDAELLRDKDEAKRITNAIDDLENAVTSVIADTRRERHDPEQSGVDLAEVVRERLAFWGVLTRAQQRTLVVHLYPDPLTVDVRRRDLEEVIDVLIGNVLRHTAPGCAVGVTTTPRFGGGGHLIVEDAGSGLRADDSGATRGSGRGLEIARRIAHAAGGAVTLDGSDLGGARVDVELGAPNA
ncbi:MAG TPA: HAMP domain-containing sensor histidine kinase [Acidimicrobiia bacterium]|jgi:signal transduction histidine kinase|nr:HAMP domain-containing sensor histidine kinase [Acidimicrobiia bacterium]